MEPVQSKFEEIHPPHAGVGRDGGRDGAVRGRDTISCSQGHTGRS